MQIGSDNDKCMSLMADVESLKEKPLPEVREAIAEKVSAYFNNELFDEAERNIACDIIRMLARDVELRVRKALSDNLKNSNTLPHDIALKLASDVLEVSLPILEFSKVLSDEDLVYIIRSTKQVSRLIAISKRHEASELISGELIKTANEDVVVSLFSNGTAKISQGSLEIAFKEFKTSGKVVGALINRGDLSVVVVEKILNAVSADLRKELIATHKLDKKKSTDLISLSREMEILNLLNEIKDAPAPVVAEVVQELPATNKSLQTENLVTHLLREGRLSESLVIRSLCEGNILFFEVSMARRAGIPIVNARMLMQDGNPAALRSLWRRAKMPLSMFDAINVIITFAVENLKGSVGKAVYSHQLLEYIHENSYDKTIPLMPYIMALIASGVRIKNVI